MLLDFLSNGFKEFSEGLATIDKKIGFKKFAKYIFLGLFVLALLNIKTIAKDVVEFVIELADELHLEQMRLRDEYITEMVPVLTELRAETGADRILYFEYHNSEENLEGIPFKFFDLMVCNSKYGVAESVPGSYYKSIGAAQYQVLFNDLVKGKVVQCKGSGDTAFRTKYEGAFSLINETDKSKQQVYVGIPGIRRPIGFIILEWMDDEEIVNVSDIMQNINDYLPRINALVVSAKR